METEQKYEIECPVCYEFFRATTSGPHTPILLDSCGHTFCKTCMEAIKANKGNYSCPYCKNSTSHKPNYSLIELLNKGYMICLKCHFPLKSHLKECQFSKKGDYCFDCSKYIDDATTSNFSLIEAMEKYKDVPHICNLNLPEDCNKQYDLKSFQTVCGCERLSSSQNLFSAFFMKNYYFS